MRYLTDRKAVKKFKKEIKLLNDQTAICTLCGSCNSSCPVYEIELTEPNSPRGKINLIKEVMAGHLSESQQIKELISVCLFCGYCQDSCSKGVDFRAVFTGYLSLVDRLDVDNNLD